MNFINTSVSNIYTPLFYNSSSHQSASTSFSYKNVSKVNLEAITLLKYYQNLKPDWDGYGATVPSPHALQKAITFILELSEYKIDVFFVAPSPNGEIIVEIKRGNANLEFEFSHESNDSVCASQDGDFVTEADLNHTTLISYIKWLICPDGNCPPNF